jgi:hypothetical protein
MGQGTLSNIAITPFKATATDARTQIIYQASELAQKGLVSGDRISAIQFTVTSKGSTCSLITVLLLVMLLFLLSSALLLQLQIQQH